MADNGTPKKRLTLDEIAELAGTTKSTVSRVLSNNPRISEATRQRVLEIVEQNDYQPNLLAQGLARGRTGLFGVLSSAIGSGFYADALQGIDMAFSERQRHIVCSFAHHVDDSVEMLREMALGGQLEGLIVLAPTLELFDRKLLDSIPMVLCAACPLEQKEGWSDIDSVTLNNDRAMENILEHLLEKGHRTIAHLSGPAENYDAVERQRAFLQAAENRPEVAVEVIPCGFIREDGQQAAKEYLAQHDFLADAFVAVNDSTASGFLEVLRERYPRNVWPAAMTGWDNDPLAEAIGLTSMAMPARELGQVAARMILDRCEQPDSPVHHRTVDMTLRVRRSSQERLR